MSPPVDPEKPKRKYPSGAQKRKKRYKAEQAPQEEARRARRAAQAEEAAGDGQTAKPSGMVLDPCAEFQRAGAPPLDDTASIVRWAAKMQAVSTWLAAMDPDLPLNDKLKLVNEGVRGQGMIRDKASEQEKLDKAAKAFAQKKGKAGKAPGEAKSLVGVGRPSTARAVNGDE